MNDDNKILIYESLIKHSGVNTSYNNIFKDVDLYVSKINFDDIITLFIKDGIVKYKNPLKITDLGIIEYNKLKNNIKKELEIENLKFDKLQSEKDLRTLEKELAKSNIETNRLTEKNSNISILISLITAVALITQIILSRDNTTTIEKEIKVKGLEELLYNSNKIEKQYDSLLIYHKNLIRNISQKKIEKTKSKV